MSRYMIIYRNYRRRRDNLLCVIFSVYKFIFIRKNVKISINYQKVLKNTRLPKTIQYRKLFLEEKRINVNHRKMKMEIYTRLWQLK